MLGKLQAAHVKGARPWAPLWALKAVGSQPRHLPHHRGPAGAEQPGPVDGDRIIVAGHRTTLRRTSELVRRVSGQSARRGIRSFSPSGWGSRRTPTCAEPRSRAPIRRRVSSTPTAAATTSTTCGSWTVVLPVLGGAQPSADHRGQRPARRADHRDQHSKLDVASLDERRRGARSGAPDSTGEFRVAEGMGATGVDEKDAAVG